MKKHMSKTFKHGQKPRSLNRDPYAVIAKMRKSEKFHHRNAPRGGANNDQPDLLNEWEDWLDEDVG